jgi:hypothetical protein
MSVDRKAAWIDYVRKLHEAGIGVMNEADRMTVGADVRDPKGLAMALLCRTLNDAAARNSTKLLVNKLQTGLQLLVA